MATAARNLVPAHGKRRRDGGVDRRTQNPGGKREGSGRKQWVPAMQRREKTPGVFIDETQEMAWERTKQEVRLYVAIGYPHEVIARLIRPECGIDTLKKNFGWELENGKLVQDAKVAGVAYFMATSGQHADMTRFWVRSRLGWRDHGDLHVPPGPIQFQKIEGDDW